MLQHRQKHHYLEATSLVTHKLFHTGKKVCVLHIHFSLSNCFYKEAEIPKLCDRLTLTIPLFWVGCVNLQNLDK